MGGRCCGTLAFRPFAKGTARHLPLHHSSLHPKSVHKSWPLSEVRRMYSRSQFWCDFKVYRDMKVDLWQHLYLDREIINTCRSWSPTLNHTCSVGVRDRGSSVVRTILPYHPALQPVEQRFCRTFVDSLRKSSSSGSQVRSLSFQCFGTSAVLGVGMRAPLFS